MEQTQVCIVGGGPAGLVLAVQLAEKGVNVTVLEAAKTYERSFRGESIQPIPSAFSTNWAFLAPLRHTVVW